MEAQYKKTFEKTQEELDILRKTGKVSNHGLMILLYNVHVCVLDLYIVHTWKEYQLIFLFSADTTE